jgi:hypothetical protein
LAYHLLHEDQVHGIVELWKSSQPSDVELPIFANVEDYLPPQWKDWPDKESVEDAITRLTYAMTREPIGFRAFFGPRSFFYHPRIFKTF